MFSVIIVPFFVAWVTIIIVSIRNEEPAGESTLAGLSAAVERALWNGDDGELSRLVDAGGAGEDYAKNYLERLGRAHPREIRATVFRSGDDSTIAAVAEMADGTTVCSTWSAMRTGGRWVLDAAPAVSPGRVCDAAGSDR
jgi:hypothetical protein